jgi:hypothetical protein
MKLSIPCKVCDRGALLDKRIHRMSGPAVVIGYILLIPSTGPLDWGYATATEPNAI